LLRWAGETDRARFLAEFERSQYEAPDDIRSRQDDLLRTLLRYALRNNEFYRQRLQAAGVQAIGEDDDVRATLAKLPPLEKREIQSHGPQMISRGYPPETLIRNQTGGSTGEPIRFWADRSRYEARVAGMMRHDRWAGHRIGYSAAYVWGAPQDAPSKSWKARLRNRLLGGQLWLDTSAITEAGMQAFNARLKEFRPRTIIAYAGALAALARYLKDRGLAAFQPQGIITSAEVLTENGRRVIEEVFGCPVYNRYGCREFSVVASECSRHEGLHLMAEGLLVEVDSRPGEAGPKLRGDLLVTDLRNLAMPMVRYRIGDFGELAEDVCRCGRGLPLLKSVEGRVTDFLVGASGQLVSGVFLATYVVAQRPSLGEVQIVQERAGQALFRVRAGKSYAPDADNAFLRDAGTRFLGAGAVVDVELVSDLERTASGKRRFSISRALPEYAAHAP
jgi:phenylacetate-CoA ligase